MYKLMYIYITKCSAHIKKTIQIVCAGGYCWLKPVAIVFSSVRRGTMVYSDGWNVIFDVCSTVF